MSERREVVLDDGEAIEGLISQVQHTSLTEDFNPNLDDDEKLCLPGYYRAVSPRYLPFICAALTMETALISEGRLHWMKQCDLVKLTAAVLIVKYSLVTAYWEDGQLYADGEYRLVHAEPDPQLVHRSAQIYHTRAKRDGLDKSVIQLLVATKLSWWETGKYMHRCRPHLIPSYLREAIRNCGLDEMCEDHEIAVHYVGSWVGTLKVLNTLGIVTRNYLSLWHATEMFTASGPIQSICPAGNPQLVFCAHIFLAVKDSPIWRTRELKDVILRTLRLYEHLCAVKSAIYHEAAAYLTGETDQVYAPLPEGALETSVRLIHQCVPAEQCSAVRRFHWFRIMVGRLGLMNIRTSGSLHVSEATEIALERLAGEIEAKERFSGHFDWNLVTTQV
ncbi:hypothetical protein D915_009784 [Fasciola hepatica]|uniref:Uncharacterized protein n=1 Tax=Fasciola hepatica TaxID=6192 RepID=A0A4E0R0I0_FASHE|nr:hypothetical protein D915_009784 [Fasciola hepatica]